VVVEVPGVADPRCLAEVGEGHRRILGVLGLLLCQRSQDRGPRLLGDEFERRDLELLGWGRIPLRPVAPGVPRPTWPGPVGITHG
jgi:hypothetical protein